TSNSRPNRGHFVYGVKTTRRLSLNWSSVQMAVPPSGFSVGIQPNSKVQVWRHNAQPQDPACDSGACCNSDSYDCAGYAMYSCPATSRGTLPAVVGHDNRPATDDCERSGG